MDLPKDVSADTFNDALKQMRILLDHMEEIVNANNSRSTEAPKKALSCSKRTGNTEGHHVDVYVQTDEARIQDEKIGSNLNEPDENSNVDDGGETASSPASEEAEPEELEELERVIMECIKQQKLKENKKTDGEGKEVGETKKAMIEVNRKMDEKNKEIKESNAEMAKEVSKELEEINMEMTSNNDLEVISKKGEAEKKAEESNEALNEVRKQTEQQKAGVYEEKKVVKKEVEESRDEVEQFNEQKVNTQNDDNNSENIANEASKCREHQSQHMNNLIKEKKHNTRDKRRMISEVETEYIVYETEEYDNDNEMGYMDCPTNYNNNNNERYVYDGVEYYEEVYTPEQRLEILKRKQAHRFRKLPKKPVSKPTESADQSFNAPTYYDGSLAWDEVQHLRRRSYNINFTTTIRCAFCSGKHYSNSCRCVKTSAERRESLLQNGRCLICLNSDHPTKRCKRSRCTYCEIAEERNLVLDQEAHHSSICAWPDKTEEWINHIQLRNAVPL